MHERCVFTSDIADGLSCDPKGDFDDNGFPLKQCEYFPCEKYKGIIEKISKEKIEHELIKEDIDIDDDHEEGFDRGIIK